MASGDEGSVTIWVGDLKAGGDAAAQPLWERYCERLVREARRRLRAAPRAVADEEDAALSAFDSFCRGVRQGRYPQLADRDDLWRILLVITRRKAMDLVRSGKAKKRGGERVLHEAALLDGDEERGGLDQLAGGRVLRGGVAVDADPDPGFVAMLDEECRRRLDALGDETLRAVALMKLEGYTDDEVAERLGCARRTVQRKLDVIRQEWRGAGPEA
jgi:DNA-directed RNA polymerase specialized sigma24 family protein